MQLLFAVVQTDDADRLCQQLNQRGYRVTRINSGGGFLAITNVTVMLGVEDDQVADIMGIVKAVCHRRKAYVNPMPWGPEAAPLSMAAPAPMEVEIGGATVFAVPVRRFLRIRGGEAPPSVDRVFDLAAGREAPQETGGEPAEPMDLVFAIVHADDAERVSAALLEAGFRFTRIPTAGAFLRRGNNTVVAGLPRRDVDRLLALIGTSCRLRAEAQRPDAGMPMFSATVFVVEMAQGDHWPGGA